jgi:hypothetical protein
MLHSLKHDFKRLLFSPNGKMAALGILLIPVDSAWFFPLDTVYRPAWIIPFVVIGVQRALVSFRLLKIDIPIILIALYILFSSAFATLYFSYSDFSGLAKMTTVVFIVTFGIIGINYFLYSLSKIYGANQATRIFASSIIVSSFLPIFIGFIQVPGEILGFQEINNAISSAFSYRYYHAGRIHLLSGEPSWAARYILFIIVISLFVNTKKIVGIRIALFTLLFFTGSALGFFTGLLLLGVYLFLKVKFTLNFMIKFLIIGFFLLIFSVNYGLLLSFAPYAIDKIDNVSKLLSDFSFEQIMAIGSIDGSILARIVNPIIAFDLALSYPFGVGGDSFKFWVIEKIHDYGYVGSADDEYLLSSGSTPKLLMAKIMVEQGLFFFLIVFVFFVRLYKKMPNINLRFLLLSVPITTLSEDSYLFYGLILPICIALMQYRLLNEKSPLSSGNIIGVRY